MSIDVKIDDIENGWLVNCEFLGKTTYVKTLAAAVTLAKKLITEAATARGEKLGG